MKSLFCLDCSYFQKVELISKLINFLNNTKQFKNLVVFTDYMKIYNHADEWIITLPCENKTQEKIIKKIYYKVFKLAH